MNTQVYNIRFDAIEVISKTIVTPPSNKIKNTDYNFSFSVDIKLGIDKKIAIVVTDISVTTIGKQFSVSLF